MLTSPKEQLVLPKISWKKHIALAQLCNEVPIDYNVTPQIHTQNCPLPFDNHHSWSNTHIPWPTALTTPNSIWIQSAILPQYTFWTHR